MAYINLNINNKTTKKNLLIILLVLIFLCSSCEQKNNYYNSFEELEDALPSLYSIDSIIDSIDKDSYKVFLVYKNIDGTNTFMIIVAQEDEGKFFIINESPNRIGVGKINSNDKGSYPAFFSVAIGNNWVDITIIELCTVIDAYDETDLSFYHDIIGYKMEIR